MEEKLKEMNNRIWKTYKIRINTAERLKQNHRFLSFMSIYYSAMLSAISILNYKTKSDMVDIFSIVLSIIVTILFLFFEGKSYKDRHEAMKKNYNDMYLIYYEIESKLNENDEISQEDFMYYSQKYVELLNSVENHSDIDYIKYNISYEQNNIGNYIKYLMYKFKLDVLYILIFFIPVVFLIIEIFQLKELL